MNTLVQMGAFTNKSTPISLRSIAGLVNDVQNPSLSMKETINKLQNLPPIKWEFNATPSEGIVPFKIELYNAIKKGLPLSLTTVLSFNSTVILSLKGGTYYHGIYEVGEHLVEFTQESIDNTGYHKESVTQIVRGLSKNTSPIEPGEVAPSINVSSEKDGVFIITGSGFLPQKPITIRVVDSIIGDSDDLAYTKDSDINGNLTFTVKINCNAGLILHFSATDGRPKTGDVTGVLWSNVVDVVCMN